MSDLDSALQSPIFDIMGVDATLVPTYGDPVTITALDETRGVEITIGEGAGGITTVRPACSVRMVDLTELNVGRADLPGGTIDLNGTTWRIEATQPRPGFGGQPTGELRLILVEQPDA